MQLALGLAGAAIGSMFGMPGLGFAVGSSIGGMLAADKQNTTVFGPRLENLKVQAASYGYPIKIPYGTVRVAGNVIWAPDLVEQVTITEQSAKGDGPSQTTVTFTYFANFAVALTAGPVSGVVRIWADSKVLTDIRVDAPAQYQNPNVRVYLGDDSQDPDPTIEAYEGAGNVPGFRGTCYLVFNMLPVGEFGNRIPNITAEIVAPTATTVGITGVEDIAPWNWTETYGSFSHFFVEGPAVWFDADGSSPNLHYMKQGDAIIRSMDPDQSQACWVGRSDVPCIVGRRASAPTAGEFTVVDSSAGEVIFYDYQVPGGGSLPTSGGRFSRRAPYFYAGQNNEAILHCYDAGGGSPLAVRDISTDGITDIFAIAAAPGFVYVAGALSPATTTPYILRFDAGTLDNPETIYIDPPPEFGGSWPSVSWVGTSMALYSDAEGRLFFVVFSQTNVYWTFLYNPSANRFEPYIKILSGTAFNPGSGAAFFWVKNGVWYLAGQGQGLSGMHRYKTLRPSMAVVDAGLDGVVSDICQRAGLGPTDLDVSDLAGTSVRGFVVMDGDARLALSLLMQIYGFEGVETGGKLVFRMRGGSPVATIPEDDLGATDRNDPPDSILGIVRAQEQEIPNQITLTYLSRDLDYQPNSQYARRLTTRSTLEATIEIPVVLSDVEAAGVADRLLYSAWAERLRYEAALTDEYLALEPGDVVTIEKGSGTFKARIIDREDGGNHVGALRLVGEETAAYSPSVVAVGSENFVSGTVRVPIDTVAFFLDLPALQDSQNQPGLYVAACGLGGSPNWLGCQLARSVDGGQSWQSAGFITSPATMGRATTALPSPDQIWTIDEESVLVVKLTAGTLASISEDQMFSANLLNFAAVGDEIVRFRDAVYDAPSDTYSLTGFLRGRRGTEWAVGTHSIGDRFVLLDPSTVKFVPIPLSDIGASVEWRAISSEASLSQSFSHFVESRGRTVEPLAVVFPEIGRDNSSNITIGWTRQTRIGGDWRDRIDAPVSEASEEYDVEIWTSGFSTLKRTIRVVGASTASYTSANQVADFGSNQSTIYVRVYQISAVAGRGDVCQFQG